LNLHSHLSTSGLGATESRLKQLRDAGLDSLQISLQDSRPAENDRLAGTASFDHKVRIIEAAKRLDLPLTLNVVLHRHNLDRIQETLDLAAAWNVDKLELAHAQYVGWAFANRAALMPTRKQLEHAQNMVAKARQNFGRRPEILHVLPDYFQSYPKA